MTTPTTSVIIFNPGVRRIEETENPTEYNCTFHIEWLHQGDAEHHALENKITTRIKSAGEDRVEQIEQRARQQLRSDLLAIVAALE